MQLCWVQFNAWKRDTVFVYQHLAQCIGENRFRADINKCPSNWKLIVGKCTQGWFWGKWGGGEAYTVQVGKFETSLTADSRLTAIT